MLEGGQGFVPTHSITDVQDRIRRVAEETVAAACKEAGAPDAAALRVTFERLHNNAFERPVDSPGVRAALAAARAAGIKGAEEVRGWEVSCDARLFADLRPDTDIVTFGAGQLRYAHSETESITVEGILKCAEALVYMALLYAG